MIPNGTDCTPCLSQCSVCNLTNSLCSVCIAGIYLYKNLCVSECPAPTVISLNATACITETAYYEEYSKASKIIPFPFSIAAFVLALICVSLKCFRPVMHIQTTLCSLVSLIEFAAWIVFLFV